MVVINTYIISLQVFQYIVQRKQFEFKELNSNATKSSIFYKRDSKKGMMNIGFDELRN